MTRAAALLLAAAAAAAAPALSEAVARLRSEDPAERAAACAALAAEPLRSSRAYAALSEAMARDLSASVRLAAARAVVSWPGGEPLEKAAAFLKREVGPEQRASFILALSSSAAQAGNPDATRLIAESLSGDASPSVRRAAAEALARRADPLAAGALRAAAESEADRGTREAVRAALAARERASAPKAARTERPEPKPGAVKGRDACPPPHGWCECGHPVIRTPAKCLLKEDCRRLHLHSYKRHGLSCEWDKQDLDSSR